MRWVVAKKKKPHHGEERTRIAFLWFPKSVLDDFGDTYWFWLEKVKLVERFDVIGKAPRWYVCWELIGIIPLTHRP